MKIRKSIFETNSSSSHTITLADLGAEIDQTIEPKNGVVEIMVGEYGWRWKAFVSAEEKASYVATAIMDYFEGKKREELLGRFVDVVRGVTGAKMVRILPLSGEYKYRRTIKMFDHLDKIATEVANENEEDWGYVDHQSGPEESKFAWDGILNEDEGMKRFIFSSESRFETGNDNG